jgi:hypothetical protein
LLIVWITLFQYIYYKKYIKYPFSVKLKRPRVLC